MDKSDRFGMYPGTYISSAIGRLSRYLVTLRWLTSLTFRSFKGKFAASAVLSLASSVMQVIPILIVARVIGGIEKSDQIELPYSAYLPDLDSSLVSISIVAVVILLVFLAGLARYVSRIIALDVEKKITQKLIDGFAEKLTKLNGSFDRWQLFKEFEEHHVIRDISASTRLCGVVIRLFLYQVINVFYLIAGLAFLFIVSPLAFIALLVVMFLGMLISYPLNLKAVALAHSLEDLSGPHSSLLQSRIRTAIGSNKQYEDDSDMIELQKSTESQFFDTYIGRWKILETSQFAFSNVFAVVLGLFLWFVLDGNASDFLSYGNLILLFFAFRYTFNGYQSLLIMVTMVNRFLPSIVRIKNMTNCLDQINANTSQTKSKEKNISQYPWKLMKSNSPLSSGNITTGQLHLVLCRPSYTDSLSTRFLSILSKHHREFASNYDTSTLAIEAYETQEISPEYSNNSMQISETALNWIGQCLREQNIELTDNQIEKIWMDQLDENSVPSIIIRQLAIIYQQILSGSKIIIVNDNAIIKLLRLSPLIDILRQNLREHVVVISSPWHKLIRDFDFTGLDLIYVSTVRDFTFVANANEISAEEWNYAESQYNEETKNPASSGIDLELI